MIQESAEEFLGKCGLSGGPLPRRNGVKGRPCGRGDDHVAHVCV